MSHFHLLRILVECLVSTPEQTFKTGLTRHPGAAFPVMKTEVAQIADDIFRLSTFVPDIAPPAGFTFNQFLVKAEEPLLFH